MRPIQKETFAQILSHVASQNARVLEQKARHASWLAKTSRRNARALYAIKCKAIRQLFRISGYEPHIRDAWQTNGFGILLSIRLKRTRSLLHVPYNQLDQPTRHTSANDVCRAVRRHNSSQLGLAVANIEDCKQQPFAQEQRSNSLSCTYVNLARLYGNPEASKVGLTLRQGSESK